MNNKEQWVTRTLESFEGASRAQLDSRVADKILARPYENDRRQEFIFPGFVWKIAAVAIVLISLNIGTIIYFQKSPGANQTPVSSLASDYFTYIDTYNLLP